MEEIIKFRKASDSLNDEEYQICINKFLKQCTMTFDRDHVVTIIFNAFCEELKDDKLDNINTMNKIIKTILKKRKKKVIINEYDEYEDDVDLEEEKVEIKKIKLEQLPQALFSNIISYLEFIERVHFEQTNRSIFLDARAANLAVHHFPEDIFNEFLSFYKGHRDYMLEGQFDHKLYSKYNINNNRQFHIFKSLTMTAMDLADVDPEPWIPRHFTLFDHIDSLKIYFSAYADYLDYILGRHFVDNLPTNLPMKFFRIIGYVSDGDFGEIETDIFYELKKIFISKLTAVEYFEVSGFFCEPASDYDFEFLSKLKGLAIYDHGSTVNLHNCIYSAMGPNVESFHHDWEITNNINGKMTELKEFCTSWCLTEGEIDIFMKQNTNYLQRIYFKTRAEYALHGFTGDLATNMVLFFEKILKTAEYIGFDLNDLGSNPNTNHRFPALDLFDTLNKSLKNKKKKKLKIRIDEMGRIPFTDSNEICDMIGHFEELVTILNRNVSHWMLIISDLRIPADNKLSSNPLKSALAKKQYTLNINDKPIKWNELNILDTNDLVNNFLSSMSMHYNVKWEKKKKKIKKSKKTIKKYNEYNVVISNQQCEISGYHEHWIMECSRCTQQTLFG